MCTAAFIKKKAYFSRTAIINFLYFLPLFQKLSPNLPIIYKIGLNFKEKT